MEGLLDPPVPDASSLTCRPSPVTSPALKSYTRTEGPRASPAAKLSPLASPQALNPPARTEPPAPLSRGITSQASPPPQSSPVSSGAGKAGAGSRLKPEVPLAKGKSSPDEGWGGRARVCLCAPRRSAGFRPGSQAPAPRPRHSHCSTAPAGPRSLPGPPHSKLAVADAPRRGAARRPPLTRPAVPARQRRVPSDGVGGQAATVLLLCPGHGVTASHEALHPRFPSMSVLPALF